MDVRDFRDERREQVVPPPPHLVPVHVHPCAHVRLELLLIGPILVPELTLHPGPESLNALCVHRRVQGVNKVVLVHNGVMLIPHALDHVEVVVACPGVVDDPSTGEDVLLDLCFERHPVAREDLDQETLTRLPLYAPKDPVVVPLPTPPILPLEEVGLINLHRLPLPVGVHPPQPDWMLDQPLFAEVPAPGVPMAGRLWGPKACLDQSLVLGEANRPTVGKEDGLAVRQVGL